MVDRGACLSRRPGPEVRSACSTHPKALIGTDGSVGQASRLRWPRRIMASIVSLRNRLATALSPSSPVRSRHSQAIWKDSSSNWESEIVMAGKRSGAAGVPSPRPIDEPWRTTLHLPAWWNLTVASIGPPVRAKAEGCGVRGTQRCAKLLQSGKREWTWTRSSKRRSTNPAC